MFISATDIAHQDEREQVTYDDIELRFDLIFNRSHLGCDLFPLDLYVMHTAAWLNPIFRQALKFLEPTRHDPVLKRFRNAHELHADAK